MKPPLQAHENVLGMKPKAHYSVTHTQIKTFTSCSEAQQVSIDNALLGTIPVSTLLGFVKNTAFVGSADTNPFHFHHHMTSLVMYVNVVQYHFEAFTTECSSPHGVTRAYETHLSCTGIHHDDCAHMITLEMFTNCFYVSGIDLMVRE